MGKARAMHVRKAKQGIHSPLSMGWQVFSNPQENKAASNVREIWDDKLITQNVSPLTYFSPRFIRQP